MSPVRIWDMALRYWSPNVPKLTNPVTILILEKRPYPHMVPDHTRGKQPICAPDFGAGVSSLRLADVMVTTDQQNAN